jgi:hypothetical protein
MNHWDNRYAERVKLLVENLPTLAKEKRFALKGGTAINLFEHDLPRLSIDIDLTWLPVGDFARDAQDISAALEVIGEHLRSGPLRLQLQTSGTDATQGMTAAPVTAASLLDVRERLLNRIPKFLDAKSRAFLESVEREAPDFDLIELPHAAELPGIRRKLANLSQRRQRSAHPTTTD